MTYRDFSKDRIISEEFALFSLNGHFIDWQSNGKSRVGRVGEVVLKTDYQLPGA